jgi:excisionase family DNA binding protein
MDYLTIQEVSSILKIHTNTVYKMCRQGVLPAVKIGKEWRIDRQKLSQFMERGVPTSSRELKHKLPQTGHVLGFFSNQQEILDFERSFFLSAPRQGYRLLKACWWQEPDEVRRALSQAGLPVAELESRGDLVFLDLSQAFEQYGPVGAAGAWFKEAASSLERGYIGIYGSGSPNFTCCGGHQGLLEFEQTLDQMLKGLPIIGVCSYAWPSGSGQGLGEVMDLIETHDHFFLHSADKEIAAQVIAS